MAARQHVDSAITERRLRPIYDYLDNGNNKKALQEAEKLIKKQKDTKDMLCAKALKALALIRLSRQDEALDVIGHVHAEGPTDDATLQAMTICYRELQKPELIADAYETATRKEYDNEELLTHLFMSYVRIGNYYNQRQTALSLNKLKPKNPYYFWAIMSIYMEATTSNTSQYDVLCQLAERMSNRYIFEDKFECEAEVQLYLMVLELQEKYEAALNAIRGPLKDKIPGCFDLQKEAELLMKLKKWPEANEMYKKLIVTNPDQWSYYLQYYETICHLVDANWTPETESQENNVDYTFEHAVKLISALVEEQNRPSDKVLRGPYLAQLELLLLIRRRGTSSALNISTAVVDAITVYYDRFGSKPCCFPDISHVLSTAELEDEEINQLLENLKVLISVDVPNGNNEPENIKQMYSHLCYYQLLYHLGITQSWSEAEKLDLISDCSQRHLNGFKFGIDLLSTELQPCDTYCLLAAYLLVDLWRTSGDDMLIARTIGHLESSLKASPSNFQIKLLLLKLYNLVGAVGATYNLFEGADIKHIQKETLGYLLAEPLLSAGCFSAASNMFGNCIRFYVGNYKDTADYLLNCYKFGSFTKIPEIVAFREKLNNSLQYSIVTVEKMILDLIETKSQQDIEKAVVAMELDPECEKNFDNLEDSRDFSIFRIWNRLDRPNIEEQITKSYQEKVVWLKMRNVMVRCIAAIYYLNKPEERKTAPNTVTNERKNMTEILSDLITNIKELVENVDKNSLIKSDEMLPIQSPGHTRLHRYLLGNNLDIFISLVELALNLYRLVECSTEAEEKSCLKIISDTEKSLQALHKRMQQSVTSYQDSTKFTHTRNLLEDFSNSVETYSLSTVLVHFSHSLLKPVHSSSMRKGKKKKSTVPKVASEIFKEIDALLYTMETTGNSLTELLNQVDTSMMSLSSRLGLVSLNDNESSIENKAEPTQEIIQSVESSYQTSLKELKDVLQTKIKCLQLLKW